MIPQKLTIQGLYSYQEKQTIDFTRLLDAQLFGIFGTVGSGKSSILEAISFAVYGDTERLNQRDNRNYNMMNLKSNELLIDFECINQENEYWRFIVQGKRSGVNFDDVRTFTRRILKKGRDGWQAEEGATPEQITGLSYENFRRTIIIPQGKFQEFLQLGDKDRTKMMKEIFRLERFEFYRRTASLISRDQQQLENLSGRMHQYKDLTPEAITLQEKMTAELTGKLDHQRKELTKKEKQRSALEKIRDIHEKRELLKSRLAGLEKKKPHYEELEERIRSYESAFRNFSEPVRTRDRLKRECLELTEQKAEQSDKLVLLKQETQKTEKQWKEVSKAYENRDNLTDKAADLKRLLKIKELEADIDSSSDKLKKKKSAAEAQQQKADDLKESLKKRRFGLKESKSARPDEHQLAEIKSWYKRNEELRQQLTETEKELAEANQKSRELGESLQKGVRASSEIDGLDLSESDDVKGVQKHLATFINDTDARIDKEQARLTEISAQMKLEAYADALEDGKPCPLCGSESHPEPLSGRSEIRLKKAEETLHQLRSTRKQADEFLKKFDKLSIQMSARQEQTEALQNRCTKQQDDIRAHREAFVWENYDPDQPEAFQQVYEKAEALRDRLRQTEREIEEMESALEAAEAGSKSETESLRELEKEMQKLRDAREFEIENIKVLAYSDYGLVDSETIKGELEGLEKQIEDIKADYNKLQSRREGLSNELSALKARHEDTARTLDNRRSELVKTESIIEEKLRASNFDDASQVTAILDETLDTESLNRKLNEYRSEWTAVREQLAALEEELGDSSFDAGAFESLQEEIKTARAEVDELIGAVQSATEKTGEMKKDMEAKKELQTQVDALRQRLENLETLRRLFTGSGFVNYISSVYLRQLCDASNRRFYQLTRQQLRLELNEHNNFQVRDFLNDGRLRSIKTLSGGQTFQASLCLALALAESVQHQDKTRQNFFFLDEGFGSLDRESLHTVFDTLKSLRGESRVVGVISHVEELQQEIDVFLRIENDAGRGSLIRSSWEYT